MVVKDPGTFSLWLLLALTSLSCSVLLDLVSAVTEGWAADRGEKAARLGLWRLCGPLQTLGLEPVVGDTVSTAHSCLMPYNSNLEWYKAGFAMEILGLAASIGILLTAVSTVICVKHQGEWQTSRAPVVALIPLASISGLINFAGAVTLARGLPVIQAGPGFGLFVDFFSAVFAGVGVVFCILDLQGVGWTRKQREAKGSGKPFPV